MQLTGEAELLARGRLLEDPLHDPGNWTGRKKRRYAYLAWLCLGSHYLYLGRPFTQALFWLTAGGLLVWWLVDLFRIGDLVRRRNRRLLRKLLDRLEAALERRVEQLEAEAAASQPVPAFQAAAAPAPAAPFAHPPSVRPRRRARKVPLLLVAASLAAATWLHLLHPPPLYPAAELMAE